jgi:DNA-binding CsgD family transcriptional regulator
MSAEQRPQPESSHTERIARVARRAPTPIVLLDAHGRVLSISRGAAHSVDYESLIDADGALHENFFEVVCDLLARCERSLDHHAIAFIDEARFVRIVMLEGAGPTYALTIECDRRRDSLARAARRFALTKRETQVLALILKGSSAHEIGAALNITETTVHGYFKRLLSKTQSRNRPSMVAAVCDWEGAR